MNKTNHYEQIGRATVIWNDVELLWYPIFLTLTDIPRVQAEAIYHSIKVFAGQSDIVFALGKAVLEPHPDLSTSLAELFNRTGQCSGVRNAIIHAKYIANPISTELVVWDVGKNRLIGKQLQTEISDFLSELDHLTRDLLGFLFQCCHKLGKDRFCLALAKSENLPAWTSDRKWQTIAEAVQVEITIIR